MNLIILIFGWYLILIKSDLKIEVMKEGLLDLKTTILRSPNVTEFSGSAEEPYIGGTSGELLPFSPIDGCSELKESTSFTEKDENTGKLQFSTVNGRSEQVIVLISRGGCNFNTKFENAKKVKGVIGVLIYNGPDDDILPGKIELTNDSDDLPGFLISYSLGLELYNKMTKYRGSSLVNNNTSSSSALGATPYIEVTMTPTSIDATNRANTMIQIALIAIIIILALSFGASIVIHMRSPAIAAENNSNPNARDQNGNPLAPIDVEFLQKLPLKTFKGRRKSTDSNNTKKNSQSGNTRTYASGIKSPTVNDEKSVQSTGNSPLLSNPSEWFEMIQHDWPMNDSCPICLDEFNQNEVLNELPCGHCYHIACIQPWLQYRSPCCPLCKLDVREEFKSIKKQMETGMTGTSEIETKSKLKNIWKRLTIKSSETNNQQEQTPPAMSTSISMTEINTITAAPRTAPEIIQVPQRAIVSESDNFQSVPL
jgi:hypothetical protein